MRPHRILASLLALALLVPAPPGRADPGDDAVPPPPPASTSTPTPAAADPPPPAPTTTPAPQAPAPQAAPQAPTASPQAPPVASPSVPVQASPQGLQVVAVPGPAAATTTETVLVVREKGPLCRGMGWLGARMATLGQPTIRRETAVVGVTVSRQPATVTEQVTYEVRPVRPARPVRQPPAVRYVTVAPRVQAEAEEVRYVTASPQGQAPVALPEPVTASPQSAGTRRLFGR